MKKKILIFIFLVITVGGIIFTAFTAYRFSTITDLAIKHSAETVRDIYLYSENKDEALQLIKNMPNIESVDIVDKSTYKKIDKNCICIPLNTEKDVKLHFKSLAEFENEKYNVILETIIINVIFIAISNLLLNWLLNPYLNIFEGFKDSIEKAKHGDFSGKLHTKLKNDLQKIVENYNLFLEQLNTNFTLITKNLNILIPNLPKSEDRLVSVQTNMEMLGDINKFKKLIEEDDNADEINNRIIDILEHKFNLKNFTLFGVDNTEENMEIIYQKGKNCSHTIGNPRECRAYRTSHEINSIKFPNICQQHKCNDMKYICIPFSTGGTFTGILNINYTDEEYQKNKDNIPYIESYLNESASIVEAKSTLNLMKKSSLTDQLTGLYNRRYLEDILEKIASSALREKSKLGILMIDIDYFKKVNDTYGHDAGDMVLKELSQVLVNSVRDSDFVVRFGGEEFIVVLQNVKDEKGILEVSEKIRKTFEETKTSVAGKVLQKTISIGVAIFPTHTDKIWECIKFSDLALYEAKRTGRNKVIEFDDKFLESADYKKA